MSPTELLTELRRAGVRLFMRGDRLRLGGSANALTDELRDEIKAHKADLLQLLAAEPTGLCSDCGCGYFRMIGGLWWCHQCDPFESTPEATLTISGGELRRRRTDVDAVIREAVTGLPIMAGQFRDWLDSDDLRDIGRGLVPATTVRAYAQEAIRQGPRELGTTAGGVRVQTYRPAPAIQPERTEQPADTAAQPTAQPVDVAAVTADALEHFTERAGVMEHDGGLTRTEAERQAANRVFEYRLTGMDQYAVLLVPDGGIESARAWCAERFGAARVVDVRKHEPGK